MPPVLVASSIIKSFAGVRALKGVSFDLAPGEVHALVGENGAGKSTFIKILTGAERPDAGSLTVGGVPVPMMTPALAQTLGIAVIYQQPSLFPDLSVAENIAIALERHGSWQPIDWRGRRHRAAALLDRAGSSLDPERLVDTLSMPEQQIVEIAKAIGVDARIVIMDEPTASLTEREVERLFRVVVQLRARGVGIIYISHRLDEVFAMSDRMTVLRDGETVDTVTKTSVDRPSLIRLMVGRELSAVYPGRVAADDAGPDQDIGRPALEVRGLTHRASGVRDVSLTVRRGEILGLAGLVGSGRTQLAEVLFGLAPADAGEIVVDGIATAVRSPRDAIAAGIAYLPEDRRRHGVVLDMSVASNASLASLDRVSRRGLIDRIAERRAADRYVERFRIKAPSIDSVVGTLSGGNQQKVALARWLAIEPAILILDEPTQGVDVGSKAEIHGLMQQLVARGLAVIMISSELPEILGMSDRVAVMHNGTIRGLLSRADATQARVMALALGHDDHAVVEEHA